MQELLRYGRGRPPVTPQKAAWHQIFDVVAENVPLYPIFHRKSPTAFDPETLVDFKPIAVSRPVVRRRRVHQ